MSRSLHYQFPGLPRLRYTAFSIDDPLLVLIQFLYLEPPYLKPVSLPSLPTVLLYTLTWVSNEGMIGGLLHGICLPKRFIRNWLWNWVWFPYIITWILDLNSDTGGLLFWLCNNWKTVRYHILLICLRWSWEFYWSKNVWEALTNLNGGRPILDKHSINWKGQCERLNVLLLLSALERVFHLVRSDLEHMSGG